MGDWSCGYSVWYVLKLQTPRRKAGFSISLVLCTSSVGAGSHPHRLGNGRNPPEIQVSGASEGQPCEQAFTGWRGATGRAPLWPQALLSTQLSCLFSRAANLAAPCPRALKCSPSPGPQCPQGSQCSLSPGVPALKLASFFPCCRTVSFVSRLLPLSELSSEGPSITPLSGRCFGGVPCRCLGELTGPRQNAGPSRGFLGSHCPPPLTGCA